MILILVHVFAVAVDAGLSWYLYGFMIYGGMNAPNDQVAFLWTGTFVVMFLG